MLTQFIFLPHVLHVVVVVVVAVVVVVVVVAAAVVIIFGLLYLTNYMF